MKEDRLAKTRMFLFLISLCRFVSFARLPFCLFSSSALELQLFLSSFLPLCFLNCVSWHPPPSLRFWSANDRFFPCANSLITIHNRCTLITQSVSTFKVYVSGSFSSMLIKAARDHIQQPKLIVLQANLYMIKKHFSCLKLCQELVAQTKMAPFSPCRYWCSQICEPSVHFIVPHMATGMVTNNILQIINDNIAT